MQMLLEINVSEAIIGFETWDRGFGSVMNHRWSVVLRVFFVLSLLLRFGMDLRGMWIFSYTRL